jgi:triosephosphate isomerase (TIM)
MKYIIANWKMNMEQEQIKEWFNTFTPLYKCTADKTILIAPTELFLEETKNYIKLPNVFVCAQDVDFYDKGAHTGYTGTFQLKEFATYSIVGHSERKEPEEIVLAKRDSCIKNNITPIVCFIPHEKAPTMFTKGALLAWEDPQNISINGIYRAKDPKDVAEGIRNIRQLLPPEAVLLYGGSVNRDNIKDLTKIEGINGYLVGNASLDPVHFLDIINNA